jgi:hypothetical protein
MKLKENLLSNFLLLIPIILIFGLMSKIQFLISNKLNTLNLGLYIFGVFKKLNH